MDRSWKSDRSRYRASPWRPWIIFLGILGVDWMGCVSNACGIVLLTRWGLVNWGLGKIGGRGWGGIAGIGGDACRMTEGFVNCGLEKESMEGNRGIVDYG